ncbi:MAG: MFS transporter [Cyanobacteria bacterium P01_H01_bin.105]
MCPLLVDIGLSLSQIGWMYGMAAYSAGLVGSLVAGVFIKSLGRVRSLLFSTLLLAGANTLHFLPAWGFTDLTVLYGVSTLFNFIYGMTSVALSTMMMDNTRLKTAGTDYTLQATILFIGSLVAAGINGFLATSIGYSGVFITSGAITLVNAIIVAKGDFKYGEGAV